MDTPDEFTAHVKLTPNVIGGRIVSWTLHYRDKINDPWFNYSNYAWKQTAIEVAERYANGYRTKDKLLADNPPEYF
jgi:hypothetical protein